MNTGELAERVGQVLYTAQAKGIRLPCFIALVSNSGAVSITRHTIEGEAEILAQHHEPEEFIAPLSALVIDTTGTALRVVIVAERPKLFN